MTPTQRVQAGKSALPDRFKQTQGQPGGMRSIPSQGKRDAFVNLQRQKFFGDRDVPEERVLRRTAQEGALNQFKSALERGGRTVGGLTTASGDPVYLAQTPGGRTVSSYAQDLAYRFGPTPREIVGDIGYGLGQFGSALGERISQGRIGILGIARDLYEQFTNSATKAKDALVKGVNKLSDIDLEVLKKKDTGEYKFLSKKPEIQEVENLEKTQMTEFDKANLIRQNMEKISMPVTEKDNTVESAKVFDDSFRRLPATGMTQTSPTIDPFRRLPGSGYQAGARMGIAAIDPGYEIVSDYKSPEVRMQELINQNKVNNTNMFDLGINKANNQISELERVFGVDMQ